VIEGPFHQSKNKLFQFFFYLKFRIFKNQINYKIWVWFHYLRLWT
jgi:hypothetical protein